MPWCLAIPITNDQPGVAARIRWTGSGEMVPRWMASVRRLRDRIERVLTESSYRENAQRLRMAIARCGGVKTAADVAELAVSTGGPVTTESLRRHQNVIPATPTDESPSRSAA